MGYRSEVGYAIVFTSTEDRDKVLGRITPEQQKIVWKEAQVLDDRILYHAPAIKWYLTRVLAQYGINLGGYPSVDAHDALIQTASEACEEYLADSNNDQGTYSLGVFMRLGEDDNDTDRLSWGEYDAPEGFPELWDLVDYRRELTVGWA